MAAEISLPLTMFDLLPAQLLRDLAEAAEKREKQKTRFTPDLAECIHTLFLSQKSPLVQPKTRQKAAEWRKMFLAAISECHRRRMIGQMRSVRSGIPGALVPTTPEGRARLP